MQQHNIFLVGLMGSGKSTIGRQLAEKIQKTFVDSDEEIVKRTGVDIQTIFEIEGEEGFRNREQQMIAELCEKQNIVLATGGGAVLRLANRQALAEHGVVVYLQADVDTLYERTRYDSKRPLLQEANPKQVLARLYHKRDPLYRSLADYQIHTTNKQSTYAVVKQIIDRLEGS